MGQPNFFIVGAPKCGTTALSEYLREHPQVFVSQPKEPHYFCADFDYYYAPGECRLEHYLRLFDDAGEQHRAVGEASVWYLYSAAAVPAIREFDPRARIIAMVRNPLEMVPSLHSQMHYMLDEDVGDLEEAWRLQDERAEECCVPESCRVPEFLQYGPAASLGAQVARLHESVPSDQLLVIPIDDLRADPGAVYRRALGFLDVPDDGRASFPPVNQNKAHRAKALARLTQRPPRQLMRAAQGVKRTIGVERLGVLDRVRARNRVVRGRGSVDPAFRSELTAYYRDDVALLGDLLGRDLSGWLD